MNIFKEGSNKKIVIFGSLIIALLLVVNTYWTGKSARKDTEIAVRNVSLLYLDELAGRIEEVATSTLKGYMNDLDVAIGLITRDDLKDQESLQAYQARIKQLYGLEKFAFVDENGLIYTSRGTRNDIDLYSFDYLSLSEPGVSLKDNNTKIVVAAPMDRLPFEDTHLVVCFIEVSMENFLDTVSLKSGSNNTTFSNLYTSSGSAMTNVVLGGLSDEDNLFSALELADIEDKYSIDKIKSDFKNRQTGVISFSYEGIKGTLYYVPVKMTDWMLTYLIRESVISEEIKTISDGILRRSLFIAVLNIIALICIFTLIYVQARKNSKLTLEKKVSETESRVKQQELEEQIALQEELLDQEKRRVQQDNMITAMASDYRSVYYVDLDSGDAICYRNDDKDDVDFSEGTQFNFLQAFTEYGDEHVDESYRAGFLEFINPSNIRKILEKKIIAVYRYLAVTKGVPHYEMLRMAGVRHPKDRDDNIVHAIGVGFTDIDSEMKESMAKNKALSDALKVAEEASKAKTAFLSNMSHEIRTPMNAIIGLDSLALNDDSISDSTRDYLEKIGNSAEHLLSLINDILDMSRIESGRMVIRNEEFSFSKLIEQINIIFSGQCTEKGLDYHCHITGNMHDHYIGDSTKLRQVLINILGNAVKFTPEGGTVELIVEQTAVFDDKTTLRFTIKDTGIGMSKEYLPKLFDTFSQEDSTSTNKYGSSGLGMAITKNIVEMLNGYIEVESEKGKGTIFKVSITLLNSDKNETADDQDIDIKPNDMSVLVIDDDPLACEHSKLVLSQAGIQTEIASSGEEALEMVKVRHARQEFFNLIIVDWKMPGMDGVETTRKLRSLIDDESAIIMLTAYNWDDVLDEAMDAGVDSFIAKPLFSGNLIEEFKAALKKKNITSTDKKKKADLTGRKILLAEDMEINSHIMIAILKTRKIETELATNGKKAVDIFSSSPVGYFDAILMDMRMPEMDGLTATKIIRGMDRDDAKKIPIIALTANAFDEDVQRSLQAGLNAHLAKPIEQSVLFETLENLIED